MQKKLPTINSAHGSETRNIINELIKLFNDMGYSYDAALKKADNILNEALKTNDNNKDVQKQINDLILHAGESDAEVIQARGEHPVLKSRLDDSERRENGNAYDFWTPPVQPTLNSHFKDGDFLKTHIYQEWLDLYTNLMNGNSEYISKTTKPNLYQGRYEYPIYNFTPENGYTKTMILGGGMHGGEKLAALMLYRFLYHLVNDWKDYPQLAYIRNNVRLIVMPLENPYGMAYTTRNVHIGEEYEPIFVNINRNFDYKFEENAIKDPLDQAAYEGESAFSLTETTYIKEVLEQYSDAIAYIDFHNMSPVSKSKGWSTVSYVPEIQPFDVDYLKKIAEHLKFEDDDYRIDYLDSSTGFNYATNRFGMHSFAPEYSPGHKYTAYSKEEARHALAFYGNVVIRYALLNDRTDTLIENESELLKEGFIRNVSHNRTTANAIQIPLKTGFSTDNHEILPQFNYSLYPPDNGYIKVTNHITVNVANNESFVFIAPKIWQEKNTLDFSENGNKSFYVNRFGVYESKIEGVKTITCTAYIPVKSSEKSGFVFSQLMMFVTSGEASIIKSKQIYEFIPTNHPNVLVEIIN